MLLLNQLFLVAHQLSYGIQGNLIKTEDKDKKFGKFGHKNVLSFLIENNYVEEAEKGACKSVFKITITFSEVNIENKK